MRTAAIILGITSIWIALGLACALWVGRRRRTGDNHVAVDPFFFPFGDMPIVPIERRLVACDIVFGAGGRSRDASEFRKWGSPSFTAVMTSADPERFDDNFFPIEIMPSAAVPRRNESDGRRESCPVSSLSSGQGAAVVLNFPVVPR
jgi:hypothetical protein